MNNYIQFYYDENNNLVAKIHKDGRTRIVKNPERVNKLVEICKKNGRNVKGEVTIRRSAPKISQQYENYVKRVKRLRILGEITDNMKLSFKNVTIGKKVAAFALAGAITATSIVLSNVMASDAQAGGTERIYYGTYLEKNDDNSTIIAFDDEDGEINYILDEEDNKTEINQMFVSDEFHFSFKNRVGSESYQNAMRYEDLFERYANMFGLDKELLIAVAAQESAGEHYNNLEGGPAIGIMQVEETNIGSEIEVYNFELGQKEKIEITEEKLMDIEQNIKIGAALLRYNIVYNDYNIPIGLQNHNMGFGNMGKVLSACCTNENIDETELKNNQTNNAWLEYRTAVNAGDPEYIEHVFSYIPNNSTISILDTEGNEHTLLIKNDYQLTNQKTNF